MDDKSKIRSTALSQRDSIPEDVRAQKSETISRRLEEIIHPHPHLKIAVFESMRSEVNLQPFITKASKHQWDLCFPAVVSGTSAANGPLKYMAFYHIPPSKYSEAREAFLAHPMRVHSRAALEEKGFVEVAPKQLDVVIVPLVAFDCEGNRLGYGGGNYDRLLPQLRHDAQIIGVAFEEQRIAHVPCQPHDQQLPLIVSA